MLVKKYWRRGCAVLLAVLVLFSFTPPGQWLLDRLERLTGMTDFQDVGLSSPFSLHVIDVGKADALCILVDGEALLIDGGTIAQGDEVADYLQRLGVKKLRAVFNTHPDDDHIGGLGIVLQRFDCGVFYCPSVPEDMMPDTQSVRNVRLLLKEKDIPVEYLSADDSFSFGNMQIDVLSPCREYESTNNQSLVLRLVYGSRTFLLMGDAETDAEEDLLVSGRTLSADVLKVGHHGSNTSTTEAFLQAVSPQFAVISTGEDGNHLPRNPVLQRLEACTELYRTDTDGTVIFCSDGEVLIVYTQNHS